MSNCVFILGNGFDLRMGMPTGYPDFIKYYEKLSSDIDSVDSTKRLFLAKVKEKIKKGEIQWKDLEIALGLFTKEVSDIEAYKEFYRDINLALGSIFLLLSSKVLPFQKKTRKSFGTI